MIATFRDGFRYAPSHQSKELKVHIARGVVRIDYHAVYYDNFLHGVAYNVLRKAHLAHEAVQHFLQLVDRLIQKCGKRKNTKTKERYALQNTISFPSITEGDIYIPLGHVLSMIGPSSIQLSISVYLRIALYILTCEDLHEHDVRRDFVRIVKAIYAECCTE